MNDTPLQRWNVRLRRGSRGLIASELVGIDPDSEYENNFSILNL